MARHGRSLNRAFRPRFFACFAARGAASLRLPLRSMIGRKSAGFTIFLPALCESGPAPVGRARGVGVRCGAIMDVCKLMRCRPAGRGRPAGTARKDFESGVSIPVLPPASQHVRRRFARRVRAGMPLLCGEGAASLRLPLRCMIGRKSAGFKIFLPALTESGPAFDRMRSCTLRLAAVFKKPRGL